MNTIVERLGQLQFISRGIAGLSLNLNHLFRRRRRLRIHPAYEDPFFNPTLDVVNSSSTQLKIVFVHVGKCAGETISYCLRQAIKPDVCALFEYHCFNANTLIRELTELKQLSYVIATRDPLERWISSFNWDVHNLVLSSKNPSPSLLRMLASYPSVQSLARGVLAGQDDAIRFATSCHMGMGLSWYIHPDIVNSLLSKRTYILRTEHLETDLRYAVHTLAAAASMAVANESVLIPKFKSDYRKNYKPGTFGDITSLTPDEIDGMKKFLHRDYHVHNQLIRHADARSLLSIEQPPF